MRRHGRHTTTRRNNAVSTSSNPRERHPQTHPRSASSASMVVGQAGLRTLGCLLHCRFPSRSRQCVGSTPCNVSFPLPLRDSAGFTPASRLTGPFERPDLHAFILHSDPHRYVDGRPFEGFPDLPRSPQRSQYLVLSFADSQDIVVKFLGSSEKRMKRESGERPELPRSGEQVRKPKKTLGDAPGKSGE